MEYEFVEEGTGKKKTFFCRITLPVDAEEPVIAEGEGTNKKQAKIIAALEACKILDVRGLLFQVRIHRLWFTLCGMILSSEFTTLFIPGHYNYNYTYFLVPVSSRKLDGTTTKEVGRK